MRLFRASWIASPAEDAQVALAVALGSHDAHRRLVDEIGIGADHLGHADGLGRAARMMVMVTTREFFTGEVLPAAWRRPGARWLVVVLVGL